MMVALRPRSSSSPSLALADITARRDRKGLGNTIDFDDSKHFGWACLFDGNANAFVMLVLVEIQNS